ncbi:hypothetical protein METBISCDRAFT_21157 [Metschnikowia bicuspidata]|uniref:AB hydrolase-1 domain-containing protein n=1 Tax=Metschnikowia bicuspidata TaxID=27322 RepID=A0A4P9ZIM2_9ASCO|nr:hypothetical protein METBISCDRAFT_21157 [Metschnikowia bicuspidata]
MYSLRGPCQAWSRRFFHLPAGYEPNSSHVKRLQFTRRLYIWWKSLQPNRLQVLQDQLVKLLFPSDLIENRSVQRSNHQNKIDVAENIINEVVFSVENDPSFPTKLQRARDKVQPILLNMEDYCTCAFENWRMNSGIEKIDFIVGHSFGAYWSASYALRSPERLKNLVLLSPFGLKRTAFSLTAPIPEKKKGIKPSLGPNSYDFLPEGQS